MAITVSLPSQEMSVTQRLRTIGEQLQAVKQDGLLREMKVDEIPSFQKEVALTLARLLP